MKQIILTLFATLCFSLSSYAIEENGINYDLISSYDEDGNYIGEIARVAEGEYSGDITIPAEIQYYDEWEKKTYTYKVCEIAESAFKDNDNITSLNIQAYVKNVNVSACHNLKALILSDSVETLDCEYCGSLTSLTIPTGMTYLQSLRGCNGITSLTIPKNITKIGDYAFDGMEKLRSITIEDSDDMLNFEGDPFESDCNVETLYLGRDIDNTSWFESLVSVELGANFTKLYDEMFMDCSELKEFTARGPVTAISESAFSGCSSLTTIDLPKTVTTIGEYAFDYSGLETISLPQSLTSIGENAFAYSDLTSITIPNSVTSIGESTFYGCENLTSVTFSDKLEVIPAYTFGECKQLLSIDLPDGLKRIEKFAFMNDSHVTYVKLPASIEYIGPAAFSDFNKLEELHYEGQLSDWVKITFNEYAVNAQGDGGTYYPYSTNPISYAKNFYLRNGKQLKDIVFTTDMDSISPMAFYDYQGTIENVTFSSGIKHLRIGKNAFTGVTATNIVIGTDLEKITGALPKGENVKYTGSMKQWCDLELTASPVDADGTINIDGQDLGSHLEITEGITRIPSNHFSNLGFSTISLPSTLTEIADEAFNNCGKVTEIVLPAQITTIGTRAFNGCDALKSVSRMEAETNSDTALSIGDGVFAYCWNLEDINLGNLDYVGRNAFWATKWYQDQPDGLMTLGNTIYEYKGENNMPANTTIEIEEGIKYISYEAFKGQENLVGVTLPSTLQSIEESAFSGCYELRQITCLSMVPPVVDEENYHVFSNTNYQNCTLYVPAESLDAYKNAQVWKDFLNISGIATDINSVDTDDKDADTVYYDLEGRKIQTPAKGHLYITNKGKKVVF